LAVEVARKQQSQQLVVAEPIKAEDGGNGDEMSEGSDLEEEDRSRMRMRETAGSGPLRGHAEDPSLQVARLLLALGATPLSHAVTRVVAVEGDRQLGAPLEAHVLAALPAAQAFIWARAAERDRARYRQFAALVEPVIPRFEVHVIQGSVRCSFSSASSSGGASTKSCDAAAGSQVSAVLHKGRLYVAAQQSTDFHAMSCELSR
jgi:hypothetical protein